MFHNPYQPTIGRNEVFFFFCFVFLPFFTFFFLLNFDFSDPPKVGLQIIKFSKALIYCASFFTSVDIYRQLF